PARSLRRKGSLHRHLNTRHPRRRVHQRRRSALTQQVRRQSPPLRLVAPCDPVMTLQLCVLGDFPCALVEDEAALEQLRDDLVVHDTSGSIEHHPRIDKAVGEIGLACIENRYVRLVSARTRLWLAKG